MHAWLLTAALIGADPFANPKASDVPALIDALKDESLRPGAVVALAKIGKPAAAALASAVADKDATVRLWAAHALGALGADAREAVGNLADAVKNSEDATLRAVAAESLGKIGPGARSAVPVLRAALKEGDPRVRSWAAVALGRIGLEDSGDIEALVEALGDEPARKSVIEALMRIDRHAVPALVKALANDNLRADAAWLLRRIDPPASARSGVERPTSADVAALVRVLANRGRSADARRQAGEELGAVGSPTAIAALVAMLDDESVRDACGTALGKIGKPAVAAVIAKLKDADVRAREAAAQALGKIGAEARDAIPALVEALADREREVRRCAATALEGIGPDTEMAVPALIKLLKPSEAEPVCQAAIKALVRAAPEAKPAVVAAFLDAIKTGNYGVQKLAEWGLKKVDPAAAAKAGIR